MVFALFSGGAGSIEIAETGVAEAVNLVEPGEHLFDDQFGFAVGVGGMERVSFFDGRAIGSAVEGGRGGENEARDLVGMHSFEHIESVGGVVAKELFRDLHG